MKYEVTDRAVKGFFEEDDYARIVRRRAEKEDFPRGGTIICSEQGKCRMVSEPDAERLSKEE